MLELTDNNFANAVPMFNEFMITVNYVNIYLIV